MVEEETNLVFVLIGEICYYILYFPNLMLFPVLQSLCLSACGNAADEVESLAAARKAALSGSEPSDSIRVSCIYAQD